MFFALSKTLHLLLMPLLWILGLFLLAYFLKSPEKKRRCLLIGIALLLIFTNPFLENEAMRAWEADPVPVQQLEQYDAAIILSGVTAYNQATPDRVHTHKGADRFLHPLQLYRLGKVKHFIITGGNGRLWGEAIPEAEQIEKILLMAGVAEEDILTETNSRNTRENAVYTAMLLREHPHLQRLLLSTSAFHMRRSIACFQKVGINPMPFATDFYATERSYTPDEIIIPSIGSFQRWHLLIHEVAGYMVYKMLGYC